MGPSLGVAGVYLIQFLIGHLSKTPAQCPVYVQLYIPSCSMYVIYTPTVLIKFTPLYRTLCLYGYNRTTILSHSSFIKTI